MKNNLTFTKILLILSMLIASSNIYAGSDLSVEFKKIYDQKLDLSSEEQKRLKEYEIIFIPGILAESLIGADTDSSIDISFFTKDYFFTQLEFLNKKYNIHAIRIKTSSYDVALTRNNIRQTVSLAESKGKKVIIISHSLGSIALIEELILNPAIQNNIGGVIFLQSPFYGTPVGEILLKSPFLLKKFITTTLPFVNISPKTLQYLGIETRENFMNLNKLAIRNFIKKIPTYTFSGIAESNRSLFKPLVDIIESGCLKGLQDKCITQVFYHGPYDKNDGLIPLKSTFLDNADFITLEKCDHAEIILNFPFEDYSKEYLTTSWLRVLMNKIK